MEASKTWTDTAKTVAVKIAVPVVICAAVFYGAKWAIKSTFYGAIR